MSRELQAVCADMVSWDGIVMHPWIQNGVAAGQLKLLQVLHVRDLLMAQTVY